MARPRRRARVVALQALYEIDTTRHEPGPVVSRLIDEERLSEEAAGYARTLVLGVLEERDRIDAAIQEAAPAFPVAQLAVVDRNILRLAIYEMLRHNEVPIRAVVNEAVELAKAFGSDSSSRFVNGVLGSISATLAR
jgi:N utilization substance protein B